MRAEEIKFKAQREDGKGWVYGQLIHNYKLFDGIKVSFIYSIDDSVYNIIPETVCQFTGLKDKNGVEIFEGDILKTDDGDIVEVRYEKIYASFGIWKEGWAFLHYFHEAVEPKDCEVIGNIHDKHKQQ